MANFTAWTGPNVDDASRTAAQDYNTRYATALKLFSGEVYNAFNDATIFKDLVRHYSLSGGKSKQFLFTGKLGTGFHTPGEAITPDAGLKSAEKTLIIDDLLISSQFVYDLDEVISQYSTRSEISKQIGEAMALHYDKRLVRVLSKAATEDSVVTGEPGGFDVNIGGDLLDAQALVDGFFEAAAVLDERSAPAAGRVAVLSPRQYYSLINSVDTNILNREIGNTQGDMNSGKGLYSIAGISIRKSNVLAAEYGLDATATAKIPGENNDYSVDNTNLAGLIFHREAAGVISAIAPTIETTGHDYHVQYQGDMIVGKLAMGAGSLRTSVAGRFMAV